jgi:hypothetical protein
MHIYIYDSFVNQKKYDSTTAKIETRITDLGLNGKIVRLGMMNSVEEVINNEIKKGAKTIVVVGNNDIFNKAINAIAKTSQEITLTKKIPLGFIPVGKKNNEIAKFLGIGFEESACNIISARRIQTLDLGLANDNYFLTEASITTAGTNLEIDQNYTLEIKEPGTIKIINFPVNTKLPKNFSSSAQDQILDLYIEKTQKKKLFSGSKEENSLIPFKLLTVLNKKKPLVIDETKKINTPVNIQIAKQNISLIVGKGIEI